MHYAIIAAGEGSRLAQEGVTLPKPLVSVSADGAPMIERLIRIFGNQGATGVSVVVNSLHGGVEVRRFLEEELAPRLDFPLYIVTADTPSSMHSFAEVAAGFPEGTDKFVLTTVDTIFRAKDFAAYAQAFEADAAADGYMAVTPFVDDEKPLYVAADEQDRITDFRDTPGEPPAQYISGGIYGLRAATALPVLRACLESGQARMRNYQRALVRAGLDLKAFPVEKIVDVDHAADIAGARSFLAEEQ